jgi:hypothetical protein
MRTLIPLAFALSLGAACATSSVEPRTHATPASEDTITSTKGHWRATLIAFLGDTLDRQIAGSASMAPGSLPRTTVVMVYILGATPLRTHPWSLHRGRCNDDRGSVSENTYYPPLVVDADGQSAGDVTLDLATPGRGEYFVAVYSASTDMETVIACGQLAPPVQ